MKPRRQLIPGLIVIILVTPGCPPPMLGPCDGVDCAPDEVCDDGECVPRTPKSTPCAQIAFACFDELASQPADSIRFRPISRWPRTTLTWRMANLLPNLDENGQTIAAAEAFSRWAVPSALIFKLVDSDADITISFESGDHGDDFAFAAPEGTLGHAFFPSTLRAGQIHLNFDRTWALAPGAAQIDLFSVLFHEIGHALGLDHSLQQDAVMGTEYPSEGLSNLTADDEVSIRRLYGNSDGTLPAIPDPVAGAFPEPPDLTALDDPDSDGDGIPDTLEVFVYDTNPFDIDTDADGVDDYTELFIDGTLPTCPGADIDEDGLPDACEAIEGTDPNLPDSDGDGLLDGTEVFSGTDPTNRDTDGDQCNDKEDSFPKIPSTDRLDCIECTLNLDCSDGEFCTGIETCVRGVCLPSTTEDLCDDDFACTLDVCDENVDECMHEPQDAHCSNGNFCDGVETCDVALGCQPGSPPDCDDDIECTSDSCDEIRNECIFEPDDSFCDDSLYCNGDDRCDPAIGCQSDGNPCDDAIDCTVDTCNESTDQCNNEPDNRDCDNSQFCDGEETCDAKLGCVDGTPPCESDATCNELLDRCEYTLLYVSNRGTPGVSLFNGFDGRPLSFAVRPGDGGIGDLGANGLVVSPHSGNLLVVSTQEPDNVKEYAQGRTICESSFLGDFISEDASGLAFGPDGDIYVTDFDDSLVVRFVGTSGQRDVGFTGQGCGLFNPTGLLFVEMSRLFVASKPDPSISSDRDKIVEFNTATGACNIFAFGCGAVSPVGLASLSNGNIVLSSFGTDEVLLIDGTDGTCLGSFVGSGAGGLDGPQGIAVGPNGNIFVASFVTNQVLEYNGVNGSFVGVFAEGGGLADPTYLIFGQGLADCNGNGAFDHSEIDDGVTADDNNNGIPDECETDLNQNGIPDMCEP